MRVAPSANIIATGSSALILAAAFPIGGRLQLVRKVIRDRGRLLSLGAGVSIAYVFVHMMPEMADARDAYATSATIPVLFRGMMVYFVALLGFMAYYGLETLRERVRASSNPRKDQISYYIHISGFAVYVWMIAYILVNRVEKTSFHIALYTVAMVAHFLTIDRTLREEHRQLFERTGRYVLAGVCALGWVVGVILPLPLYVLALMVAFVSGAIIMNSSIMELLHRNDERFLAFLTGGVVYGLLLIPIG
jgi:hypothetical protein